MRVLVVEDDEALATAIVRELRVAGYAVDSVCTTKAALEQASISPYDIAVLDMDVADKPGVWLCMQLRQRGHGLALLLIASRTRNIDRIAALDAGADDCILKPIDYDEMKARIRALLRRVPRISKPVISVNNVMVDTGAQRVFRDGQEVTLTTKEYSIFEYLARNAGTVITRAELCEHVWDDNHDPASHALEVHISSLRAKLGSGRLGAVIRTRRGAGYVLDAQ